MPAPARGADRPGDRSGPTGHDRHRQRRTARFAATIDRRPELGHVWTRVRTPGQNGVRERGFESLKYERLYREHITDGSSWPSTPRPTGSSTMPSGRTSPCPGTAPPTSTAASPTPTSPTLTGPESCHPLDAGQLIPTTSTQGARSAVVTLMTVSREPRT